MSTTSPWASARHRSTVLMIVAIVATAILFDGYDLVIYGAVLSTLINDPSHIGELSPAVAGTLGSYAMIGVMLGALGAGALGDRIGRRTVMLLAIAWFSIGMAATAMATSIAAFGILRFITGLGVGMVVATGGAIVAEFAPSHRKNLYSAIVYSGVPAGGVMASVLALLLEDVIGWRGLFMFGGSPILFLLPLAFFALPESPRWLMTRGRKDEAEQLCEKFGLPKEQFMVDPGAARLNQAFVDENEPVVTKPKSDLEKTGFAGIFSRTYLRGTILIGIMSFVGLLATYGLNTWLPLIMQDNGATQHDSLYSLLALNGGAVIGGLLAARIADRVGAKRVIVSTFLLAAVALGILPLFTSIPPMYPPIALAGIGVLGTQVLIYGLSSNFYGTAARAAGVAWCAGFGRLGGIVGPLVGGLLLGAGFTPGMAFYVFAGIVLIGALVTSFIPRSPASVIEEVVPARVQSQKVATS